MINRRIIEYVLTLKKEISELSKKQQDLQKQLIVIEEKSKAPETAIVEIKNAIKNEVKTPLINLTETENQIINFIINEGPKTAPEVEKKIEKTREHTARLMKKLWQEGFIERDTHRVPFTYRVNEKLKERLETTKIDT